MKFAVTGRDARFAYLIGLLEADGHTLTPEAEADWVIPPPGEAAAAYYAGREDFAEANARLTAEGALAILVDSSPRALADSRVLVTGSGKLARAMTGALEALGAGVTVASRRRPDWAGDWRDLSAPCSREADAVVNTVPAPILGAAQLGELRPGTLCLELASAPGGIDGEAARAMGLNYRAAPGLPGKTAPETAAGLIRDAVYAAAGLTAPAVRSEKRRVGLAMCGSFCTMAAALDAARLLARRYDLVPILSETAAATDTRFGPAAAVRAELETLTGRPVIDSIPLAEPLGPQMPLDALVIVPCTGNTLAKLNHGITDTAVTMAAKAHLRNGRPLILALSTNDGLSGSAPNIAGLLNRKQVYFVPFGQDDPEKKPAGLAADLSRLGETVEAALAGRQIQPVLK